MKSLTSFPLGQVVLIIVGAKFLYDGYFGVSREIESLQKKKIDRSESKNSWYWTSGTKRARLTGIVFLIVGVVGVVIHYMT